MNEIVIGVKPIAGGGIAENDEDATAAVGAIWVTYNGIPLPCAHDKDSNLISVKVEMDYGPTTVELKLIGGFVRTVRWDGPEAPPEFRKDELLA